MAFRVVSEYPMAESRCSMAHLTIALGSIRQYSSRRLLKLPHLTSAFNDIP